MKEMTGIQATNDILGLDVRIPHTRDFLLSIEEEIRKIIKDVKENTTQPQNSRDFKRKWSMIQKIEGFDDLAKHLTFIQ